MNLTTAIARIRMYRFLNFDGRKTYKTYREAAAKCTPGLYENVNIIRSVRQRSLALREHLQKQETANISTSILPLTDAIYRIQALQPDEVVNIIDFGGEGGNYYFFIRKIIPGHIRLQWHVVDTGEMVSAMKAHETAELRFYNSVQEITTNRKIDIVFTSGTLQYTETPYQTLNDLLNVDADILIFNRMSLSLEAFDIISIQTSLLSWHGHAMTAQKGFREKVIRYPHTNMRKDKFEQCITGKYHMLYTFEERSGLRKVKDFKVEGGGYFCIKK